MHKNLVIGVVECLKDIFLEGKYADNVIARKLKSNSKWGKRDRNFIAENTYAIVRNKRLLYEVYQEEVNTEQSFYDLFAIHLLIIKNVEGQLPDWKQFSSFGVEKYRNNYNQKKAIFYIKESYSDWMYNKCVEEIGEEQAQKVLASMNLEASLTLRINTLKLTTGKVSEILTKESFEHQVIDEQTIIMNKKVNVFKLDAFKQGQFEVQDYGSQQIGTFTKVKPNQKVIDACAGAGGKSLHLAAMMQNKGEILCIDVEAKKLEELKKRAKRNGVKIITTKVIKGQETIKKLYNSADVLLLDVPCTGIGVIRRNPDAKWKITAEKHTNLLETQQNILREYSKMVKKGGQMIYATCSILPSENELQIELFLKENLNFKLESEQTLYPSDYNGDGFYMARLKKN